MTELPQGSALRLGFLLFATTERKSGVRRNFLFKWGSHPTKFPRCRC